MWRVDNPKVRGWYLCKVVGTKDTLPLMYNTNGFWVELSGKTYSADAVLWLSADDAYPISVVKEAFDYGRGYPEEKVVTDTNEFLAFHLPVILKHSND